MIEYLARRLHDWLHPCRHYDVRITEWVENNSGPVVCTQSVCKDCGEIVRLPNHKGAFDAELIRHLDYARSLAPGVRMEIRYNEHGQYYSPLSPTPPKGETE